jgi:hypothetical protein
MQIANIWLDDDFQQAGTWPALLGYSKQVQ